MWNEMKINEMSNEKNYYAIMEIDIQVLIRPKC